MTFLTALGVFATFVGAALLIWLSMGARKGSSSLPVVAPTVVPMTIGSSADLCLVDVDGHPVVEVRTMDLTQVQLLGCPDGLGRHLAPLQQTVQSLVATAPLLDGKTVRVSVHVSNLVRQRDGTLIGVVRDSAGRFRKLPTLKPISLTSLIGPAAFQAVSMIVAQQHLAEISRKLDDIKHGVDRIERFQRAEQTAKIHSGLEEIAHQVLPPASRGEWDQHMVERLNHFETTFAAIGSQMTEELGQIGGKLAKLSMVGASTSSAFAAYDEELARLGQAAETAVLSLEGRTLAARVLALKPPGPGISAEDRLNHIAEDVDRLERCMADPTGPWNVARVRAESAKANLVARPFISKALETRKAQSVRHLSSVEADLRMATSEIRDALLRAGDIPAARDQPIDLAASFGPGGEVTFELIAPQHVVHEAVSKPTSVIAAAN